MAIGKKFELATHLTLIACFISYEKWVPWRENYPNNTCLTFLQIGG